MRLKNSMLSLVMALLVSSCSSTEETRSTAPVTFQAHDIAEYRGGYAVEVADFNSDGLLDVVANSTGNPELVWHENPTWEPHVIVSDTRAYSE